jgi:ABC-type multidrug transport system ATPase subunit
MTSLGEHCNETASRSLFEAKELTFSYPGLDLLSGLSFAIKPGLTLLRGGSGRGKKTLLRLISGELQPSSGLGMRQARTQWCEDPADPGSDDIVARAWLAARRPRFSQWQADLEADLIEGFGLSPHIDKPLYMLSTGSRRKVGLLGAAASGAELTLIDRPFTALDTSSSHLLTQLLAEAAAGQSRAWVMADYELPASLSGLALAGLIDLGD